MSNQSAPSNPRARRPGHNTPEEHFSFAVRFWHGGCVPITVHRRAHRATLREDCLFGKQKGWHG
jgi:hypothetical protein